MSPVHERPVGATVEWYTPPTLFAALGLRFDLDPASPGADEVPWIPARQHFTLADDGLARDWHGRVWLNPPYGPDLPEFVQRMCRHGNGVMLTASRTETRWWQQAARSADAVVLLRERIHFIRGDGHQARSSHASTLFAWGAPCSAAIIGAGLGWHARRAAAALARSNEASNVESSAARVAPSDGLDEGDRPTHPMNLDELEALEAAATAGPWEWWADGPGTGDITLVSTGVDDESDPHVLTPHVCEACRKRGDKCMSPSQPDAAFIAAIRDAAPELIRLARLGEGLDGAYRERNAVVAALIRTHPDWPCWLRPAPDAEGWWIVYAETPEGQVSWHFGPDDLDLFGGLENANGEAWDGHTTEEKYRRLAALQEGSKP